MHSSRLYIIGNGFDLAHGIESHYQEFRDYISIEDPPLFEIMEKYFYFEDNWSDFESSLAELDVDELIGDASDFLVSYGAEDWKDAYHHDYQFEVDQKIEVITEDLLAAFLEWILQLTIPDAEGQRVGCFKEGATYLNFNYTSTLESLYLIPKEQIVYLHNKAVDEHSHLILGHGTNPEGIPKLNNIFEDDGSDPRVTAGNDSIQNYYKSSFKSTKEIIQEHEAFFASLGEVTEIYVLGHSLSKVDMPYFEEMVKRPQNNDSTWKISYLNEDEVEIMKIALMQLGVEEENIQFGKLEELIK